MENNNEENVVENKSEEVKHCDKEFHHNHCMNNNTLAIIAIILSVIAIGMSSYTLGAYSNKNVRVKNNARQSVAQEQIATTGNTKRCPMWNQNFDGEFGKGWRNFGMRNWNNGNFSGPRFNNQSNRNSSRNHLRNNSNRNWVDKNDWNFDRNNWRNSNSDFMGGWRNYNSNSDTNQKSDSNLTENKEPINNNGNEFNRNFNNERWSNWWKNNSGNNRRQSNNKNNNIEPGSLPKINGNDQAPNTKGEDIKQPLPVPPKVEVR